MLELTRNPWLWLKLFVFGGIGGALCDQLHVQGQVLSYPDPVLFGQSWWVAPNFGLAACVMYLATSLWASWAERKEPLAVTRADVTRQTLWFLAAYFASAGMHVKAHWLAVLYGVVLLRRLIRRRDALPQLVNAVGLAVGGTVVELVMSSAGWFSYAQPSLGSVPLWLPGLYLHGAPLAMAVVRMARQRAALPLTESRVDQQLDRR